MKLVKEGSIEYNVYQRLSQEESLFTADPQTFGCVIPPLDFIELYDGLSFIVMPRWGGYVFIPRPGSIREVLHIMRCCLKGLSVLHRNLIVHRDIKTGNMLVNHFSNAEWYDQHNDLRPSLRSQGLLYYALMDFDFSAMFPLDSKPLERRLPAKESFIMYCSRARDTEQGELDYDPFAFDVASLGEYFCEKFQNLSSLVPMLAPFLDRMITRDIQTRFTASEALQFFEEHVLPSLSQQELDTHPPRSVEYVDPEEYDRWAGLDPQFVEAWSNYRLPRLPWQTRVLRWICMHEVGMTCVRSIRKVARAVKGRGRLPPDIHII
ncbi:hypothetical protein BU15DRAFT_49181 [Melanogaster broomeanus]|nr:hypothetical protein BU15DRAFT_49181 [Melanogaster broomeanus]